MSIELVHIGFGNILAMNRVIAIASPNSAPTKRIIQERRNNGQLVDMTNGRRSHLHRQRPHHPRGPCPRDYRQQDTGHTRRPRLEA
jgi:hypothetical protein